MEAQGTDAGHGQSVSQSSRTRGLAACALAFLLLGAGVQFASEKRENAIERPGLTLTSDLAPSTAGEWQFVGQRDGWMGPTYLVGSTLLAFNNDRGSVIGVTAAASQEHDSTFANVSTVHEGNGHDITGHVPVAIGPGPDGRMANLDVAFYSESPQDDQLPAPFAYAAVYFDGKHFSTSVVHLKVSANLSRAVGRPQPWVVAYFVRNTQPEDTPQQVSQEMAEFITAVMPMLEDLWSKYARHSD